jgi:hypothetical protein
MKKLRYIAPGVIAGVALVGGPAAPALAATPHAAGCTVDKLCLWYSDGDNSAIWKTDAVSISNLTPYKFTGDYGNGSPVRNDAHSYNTSVYGYYFFSKVGYSGYSETIGPDTPKGTYSGDAFAPGPKSCAGCHGMRNNESGFLAY